MSTIKHINPSPLLRLDTPPDSPTTEHHLEHKHDPATATPPSSELDPDSLQEFSLSESPAPLQATNGTVETDTSDDEATEDAYPKWIMDSLLSYTNGDVVAVERLLATFEDAPETKEVWQCAFYFMELARMRNPPATEIADKKQMGTKEQATNVSLPLTSSNGRQEMMGWMQLLSVVFWGFVFMLFSVATALISTWLALRIGGGDHELFMFEEQLRDVWWRVGDMAVTEWVSQMSYKVPWAKWAGMGARVAATGNDEL